VVVRYSVGKWDGDTLLVETAGFRDDGWLDIKDSPLTSSAKMTERFLRPDFGNLELQITVDDSKAYTKPWTVTMRQKIWVDAELIEFICNEGERDAVHLVASNVLGSFVHCKRGVSIPSHRRLPSTEPLARTANRLTVTMGGSNAPVQFAGLTQGYPDVYQISVVVPEGVQSGSAGSVVLSMCLPTRSTMHHRPSRGWMWAKVSAATSERRRPQPRRTARIARSRSPEGCSHLARSKGPAPAGR
jgi:hypothetical protein